MIFSSLEKIVETSNPPEDISNYVSKENEVEMVRAKYNPQTDEFLAIYEIVGFIVLRGSPEEVFSNYGYDKEKSKVLYSHYRRGIPNSFRGKIFHHHGIMIESGKADSEFSNIYFFLPSITDRSAEINKYLNNAFISPIDFSQEQLNNWAGVEFNPSKLDL